MHRSFPIAILAGLALALPASAATAAAPKPTGPPIQQRSTDDFVDDDFCGTGEDVTVHVESRATVWPFPGEEGPDIKVAFNDRAWLTYGDVTLVDHFAGVSRLVDVTEGSEQWIETGLRAKLKLQGGGVLVSDHGLLEYRVMFDEETGEFLGIDVLRDQGGHPTFANELWCAVATAAFGIPFEPEG